MDERRAERERLEDVGPAPDARIEVDRDPAGGGGDDLGQGVERGRDRVELAAAVVRDDDAVDAVREGQVRVLGGVN